MKSLVRNSIRLLYRKNVPQVQNSIRILKNECFKSSITEKDIKKFKRLIKLRSIHYPIQYLCKDWPFRELNLILKRPILIPRFQSQFMIQTLISAIKKKYKPQQINKLKFIQYGCGSGALGLSLIKQLKLKGTLIDINKKCIQQTQINAKINHIDIGNLQLITGDMCKLLDLIQSNQIIISNPPYLSQKHYKSKLKYQIKRFQDKLALVANNQGMFYIQKILNFWKQRGKAGIIMIQYDGRKLDKELQWVQNHVVNDQYGKRRFILIQK